MTRWMIGLGLGLLLTALRTPEAASAQGAPLDTTGFRREGLLDSARQSSFGAESLHHQRKVTRQLGELEPVLEWQWGAIGATALAMLGAILLTLPVALVYMCTRPAGEYDASLMHSSIMLAPTIAGILIVIQGSLAMAFSLAGVATAVRFRNSVKDTNDAVYVFVAVAIGLAAGGQALDIALAISTIFSVVVLLLSRSPFRITGHPHQPVNGHHRHHRPDMAGAESGYFTFRANNLAQARAGIEACLERATKRWSLVNQRLEAAGQSSLLYAVRFRRRYPPELLLRELHNLAQASGFTVEAVPGPAVSAPVNHLSPLTHEASA